MPLSNGKSAKIRFENPREFSMSEFSLFYVTCPNPETAESLGLKLLDKKLIACTNIIPGMKSQYWWQGKIETASEVVLILKGRSSHKTEIETLLKAHHPYENPCFIQIEIKDGSEKYLDWLRSI